MNREKKLAAMGIVSFAILMCIGFVSGCTFIKQSVDPELMPKPKYHVKECIGARWCIYEIY